MTVVSLYVSVNWVKSMCSGHIYHNFSCCDDLSKFGKEYLNLLKCEYVPFFSIKLWKFWHTARLSRTNRHKVIKSENSPVFFGPPCIVRVGLFRRGSGAEPRLLKFFSVLWDFHAAYPATLLRVNSFRSPSIWQQMELRQAPGGAEITRSRGLATVVQGVQPL